jgi:lipopolysaccharide/colanic/teichoic acid biosynthesis glycosyltransferase
MLLIFKVYSKRFKSSWELFEKVFLGLFCGMLLSIIFVYVLRIQWGEFPVSVFGISFLIGLFLVFTFNRCVLKAKKRICKNVVILGKNKADGFMYKSASIERRDLGQIESLVQCSDIDEIVITEKITRAKDFSILLCLQQRLKMNILFTPSLYFELLSEKINGDSNVNVLSTFIGRGSASEESLMRALDVVGGIFLVLFFSPLLVSIPILIKFSSPGNVIYKQRRVGKDGEVFTIYKFRTMIKDAEKKSGFKPAIQNDPRITRVGRVLRVTRLDEFPQLLNIIMGNMSLVGPRPENIYRVENHRGLQGVRLTVKPGLTGLAQIRSYYDLLPRHKVKYDYLYIQRRSFFLNLSILAKTLPSLFLKKGW